MNVAKDQADVIVIGGGPAGLSAAGWCSELGLSVILLEREPRIGGQLRSIHNRIDNYLGIHAENGEDLLAHFQRSADDRDFVRSLACGVTSIDPDGKTVTLDDGRILQAEAIVVATGVRRRKLDVPGEAEFRGKGILKSGVRDKDLVVGKRVVIVGGGDAALENALHLSEVASSVTVVHRSKKLRARRDFVDAATGKENVRLLIECVVTGIVGDTVVKSVDIENRSTGQTISEPAEAVLIRIGVEPDTKFLGGVLDVDGEGYIKVNALAETSVSGVFAIGDVANPIAPTISTATGTGATAAKAIFSSLRHPNDI